MDRQRDICSHVVIQKMKPEKLQHLQMFLIFTPYYQSLAQVNNKGRNGILLTIEYKALLLHIWSLMGHYNCLQTLQWGKIVENFPEMVSGTLIWNGWV